MLRVPFVLVYVAASLVACGDSEGPSGSLSDAGAGGGPDAVSDRPDGSGGGQPDAGSGADAAAAGDAAVEPCDPADRDSCPVGQTCGLFANIDPECVEAGTGVEYAPCQMNTECERGLACVNNQCLDLCRTADDCFTRPASCLPFADSDLGSCWQGCDPPQRSSDCPEQQVCTSLSLEEFACRPAGTAGIGDGCDVGGNNCAPGGHCADIGDGPLCYRACGTGASCGLGSDCLRLNNTTLRLCQL